MYPLPPKPWIIAGPCALEGLNEGLYLCRELKKLGANIFRAGVFKGQNRPIINGKPCFWGMGEIGLQYLSIIGTAEEIPVVTEIQSEHQLALALKEDIDIIQVGARHMQNFPLIRQLAKDAQRPIILKRGLGNTIDEWLGIAEHLGYEGNNNIILCERGVVSFERSPEIRWRLDVLAIPQIRYTYPRYSIIADVSHGVGRRELVIPMARAALAAGADGIMVEVHLNPDKSPTDARQTISIEQFGELMKEIEIFK